MNGAPVADVDDDLPGEALEREAGVEVLGHGDDDDVCGVDGLLLRARLGAGLRHEIPGRKCQVFIMCISACILLIKIS